MKAALTAVCAATVYEWDEVPGSKGGPTGTEPNQYLMVSVEPRFVPANRMTAQSTVTGWRVIVRSIALKVENVERGLAEASTALNEKRLTVASKATTPIQFESFSDGGWDDNRFVVTAFYTYAH